MKILVCLLTLSFMINAQAAPQKSVARTTLSEGLAQGRVKYKKGDFIGAVKSYESIGRSSRDYVRSREELGWAYLRAGEFSKLQGLLAHLNSDLVPIDQRLEGRVLSAITYLKKCQYDGVKKEIAEFQKEFLPLAKALESPQEAKRAARIKPLVTEAILKMRYVKLELLSQLQWIEKLNANPDVLSKNGEESKADQEQTKTTIAQASAKKMVFPVEKDIWVDELFNARAVSENECESLQQRGKM